MKSKETKKRNEISILTAFFCIAVIFIHLTAAPVSKLIVGSWPYAFFYIFNKSLSFVVPGFIFLSGLKLAYSYRQRTFTSGTFLYKRFSRIFIPYIFWYILYYLYFLDHGFMAKKNIGEHILSFCLGTMVSPFYFITIIMQFYLLFGLFHWAFQRFSAKKLLLFILVIQLLWLKFVAFPRDDRFFLTYILYFAMGCGAGYHFDSFQAWIKSKRVEISIAIWYIIILLFFTINAYTHTIHNTYLQNARIISCLFSGFSILFFYRLALYFDQILPAKLMKTMQLTDQASYYIFLSHSIMIYICNDWWYQMGRVSIVGRFLYTCSILFPTVFIGCILYTVLKESFYKLIHRPGY